MTTLRGSLLARSAMASSAAATCGRRGHGRPGRLRAFPAIPDSGRIRPRLTCRGVTALRVVDLRLRERPGTGDGCGGPRVTDDREPPALAEVTDLHDRRHHC